MIIGVDCDEVLSETIDEILKREPLSSLNLKKPDIISYYLSDIESINLTKEQAAELFFKFFESEDYWNTKPVKGAFESLQRLKKMGHTLYVVTARADDYKEQTMKRVEKYYPNIFSGFLFKNQFKENEVSKSDLCKEKGIQLLIDDNIDNIQEINDEDIPGILLDKPRNKGIEDDEMLIRANSREEIDSEMILSFLL